MKKEYCSKCKKLINEKVYCEKCKHYYSFKNIPGGYCSHPQNIKYFDTYLRRMSSSIWTAEKKNKNNNCKCYEEIEKPQVIEYETETKKKKHFWQR